jgi:lipid-binding SYLF domain-containing protein
MHGSYLRTAIVALTILGISAGPTLGDESAEGLIKGANDELQGFFEQPEWEGVRNLMGGTQAVLIAPEFHSGSLILGYEEGAAVLLVRHGAVWSDPVFVELSQTSVGVQVGVKESQLLMFVLTRQATDDIVKGVSRVGGSGGFALGSLGVGGAGGGGISGGLQMLTVSTSEGLSLGTGIANIEVAPLNDLNASIYGDAFDMADVLGKPAKKSGPAELLLDTLTTAVSQSWGL